MRYKYNKNVFALKIIAASAAAMAAVIAGCGSSGVTEGTTVVDSLEELSIEGLNDNTGGDIDNIDVALSEAFEDIYNVMSNDAGWVKGGNDILEGIQTISSSIEADLNGGEDYEIAGTWTSTTGMTLDIANDGEGSEYACTVSLSEGEHKKMWSFKGEWDAAMGSLTYADGVYSEALVTDGTEGEATAVSSDVSGHISYLHGELVWTTEGEPAADGIHFTR